MEALAKAKYNSDYIVCDKERYIEWLKAWHEADYSLPSEGIEGTDYQRARLQRISVYGSSGRKPLLRHPFKLIIFGEERYYSALHIPYADDKGNLLPNLFFEEDYNYPEYWDDKDIALHKNIKQQIDEDLKERESELRKLLCDLRGFSFLWKIVISDEINAVFSNCIIADSLHVNAIENGVHLESCVIGNFNCQVQGLEYFLSKNTSFHALPENLIKINATITNRFELIHTTLPSNSVLNISNVSTLRIEHSILQNKEGINADNNSGSFSVHIKHSTIEAARLLHHHDESDIRVEIDNSGIKGPLSIIYQKPQDDRGSTLAIKDSQLGSLHIRGFRSLITEIKNVDITGNAIIQYLEECADLSLIGKHKIGGNLIVQGRTYGIINIQNYTIAEKMDLSSLSVSGSMTLAGASIHGDVNLRKCKSFNQKHDTFPEFSFTNNTLYGEFDVSNRIFTDSTSFENTKFQFPPKFHGAQLHPNTSFPDPTFFNLTAPDKESANKFYRDAESSFRVLRHAMEGHRSKHEEAKFFGLELESRRLHSKTSSSEKMFSWLYKTTSNYGQSIGMCLRALAIWNLSFFIAYFVSGTMLNYYRVVLDTKGYFSYPFHTVMFTLEQIFRPFQIWHPSYFSNSEETKDTTQMIWIDNLSFESFQFIKLIATTQSVGTAVLFALLLIVIRRKFQLS